MKFAVGQPVTRIEDTRLITGEGSYTDDLKFSDMCYGAFVRSPYAHAKILKIDIEEAKKMPGVIDILTADSFINDGITHMSVIDFLENKDGTPMNASKKPILANEVVRHVGDPVVFIIADSVNEALDASDHVLIEYEELPSNSDTAKALDQNSPKLFDEFSSNCAVDWGIGSDDDWQKVKKEAHHISHVHLINNRIVVNPIEPRSAVSIFESDTNKFTVHVESQGPHAMRERLANTLNIKEEDIQVITKDVGGGFGLKMMCFPEYIAVMHASKLLSRPVKWTATRSESFLSDAQGRDHVTDAYLALDKEGKFLGVKVDTVASVGAYLSQFGIFIPTLAAAGMHVGVYNIPVMTNNVKVVYTNTVPIDAYRGAGRPEASYVIERLVDQAARDMSLNPIEIRRKNYVQSSDLGQTKDPVIPFDSCDFDKTTDISLLNSSFENFESRKNDSEKRNKLRGVGISYYVERTQGEGQEDSRIIVSSDGKVKVFTGTMATGQGHETAWTQIVVEKLGVNPEAVSIHFGDSNDLPSGGGTGGSKSLYFAAGAINDASNNVLTKGMEIAANELETSIDEIEYNTDSGPLFEVKGTNRNIDLFSVAKIAEEKSNTKSLDGISAYEHKDPTYPNGCHICEVEVDKDTGDIELVDYYAADDFGKIINPLLVAGQVHGGIVQGLGQAMCEHAIYDDETGQLVNGSYMDYQMPRADDFPHFNIEFNEDAECTTNLLGAKGCGEAGTVASTTAYVNAVINALSDYNTDGLNMPINSKKVWEIINNE
ncbi:MAG: xanthine dehydrogenase family protein molybdopterin-binding subunit [Pseudomonadota bacterium]|nr:xanthine dehydrogenase family protein molybdopterin-binding subunit [Pseudomonadota bacterium]